MNEDAAAAIDAHPRQLGPKFRCQFCCQSGRARSRVSRKYATDSRISALLRGVSWRGRMGVEPTSEGSTPTHTVLKTGEATGPHPPPWRRSERVARRSGAEFSTGPSLANQAVPEWSNQQEWRESRRR